jgi:plastocyanin
VTERRAARLLLAAATLVGAACGRTEPSAGPVEVGAGSETSPPAESAPQASPRRVDPRRGGFEVGFGEFAVTLETEAIRPGPVTFVVTNGGALVHGFEMEIEGEDGDSSGPGSGDGFKIERPSFGPGETIEVPLDLAPGVYKVECWVANHDDRGMEALLEVRPDAPKIRVEAEGDAVSIEGFAFQPDGLEVPTGTEVTWTNGDPEAHTVTAAGGVFDSGPIDPGGSFSHTFTEAGTYDYICSIHPSMTGTVTVD